MAADSCRAPLAAQLARLGRGCVQCADPYAAMRHIAARPADYETLIVSLAGLYAPEVALVSAVKRLYPHVELWLAHSEGRAALLAQAVQRGADGLWDEHGPHRLAQRPGGQINDAEVIATSMTPISPSASAAAQIVQNPIVNQPPAEEHNDLDNDFSLGDPVLSAEELRALLQEQPASGYGT